jgi:alkylhydroperoxidase/carboxymuconolactone decarboxylase family protein YurZ
MNVYEDLEEKVKARGVRVEERLEILRTLQQYDGGEQLATMMDEHERAIEKAAKKVGELIR